MGSRGQSLGMAAGCIWRAGSRGEVCGGCRCRMLCVVPLVVGSRGDAALLTSKERRYGTLSAVNNASFSPWARLCVGAFFAVAGG